MFRGGGWVHRHRFQCQTQISRFCPSLLLPPLCMPFELARAWHGLGGSGDSYATAWAAARVRRSPTDGHGSSNLQVRVLREREADPAPA